MHIQTAFKHIRRSPYQTLSAVMIMTFTFFVATIFILIALGSHTILKYFEAKPQITVFFKDKTKKEDQQKINRFFSQNSKVSQVKYVSQEEALAIYKEQNKNDPLLLEMVTADILPASLEISTTNVTDLKEIYSLAKKQNEIEEVIYQKDVVENLTRWTRGIRLVGLGILCFLIIDSILIILTIIGMKIALRKEEIEILLLLGASNWYVRWPFILEGTIYGLSGGLLGWLATYLLLWQSSSFLSTFLSATPLYPIPSIVLLIILGLILVSSSLIGALGSFLAVKRFLK